MQSRKPSAVGRNTLKYQRLDASLREQQRRAWNAPVWWPLLAGLGLLLAFIVPALVAYRRRERRAARRSETS